jgi:hypothetical protein
MSEDEYDAGPPSFRLTCFATKIFTFDACSTATANLDSTTAAKTLQTRREISTMAYDGMIP